MAQKTFSFTKKPRDLSKHPEALCNRIRVGVGDNSLVFTLKQFKEIKGGHDDSLPYTATLLVNNEPMYECFNDGWGGETQLTLINKRLFKRHQKIEEYISQFKWKFGLPSRPVLTMDLTLHFIADILAETESYKEE